MPAYSSVFSLSRLQTLHLLDVYIPSDSVEEFTEISQLGQLTNLKLKVKQLADPERFFQSLCALPRLWHLCLSLPGIKKNRSRGISLLTKVMIPSRFL